RPRERRAAEREHGLELADRQRPLEPEDREDVGLHRGEAEVLERAVVDASHLAEEAGHEVRHGISESCISHARYSDARFTPARASIRNVGAQSSCTLRRTSDERGTYRSIER